MASMTLAFCVQTLAPSDRRSDLHTRRSVSNSYNDHKKRTSHSSSFGSGSSLLLRSSFLTSVRTFAVSSSSIRKSCLMRKQGDCPTITASAQNESTKISSAETPLGIWGYTGPGFLGVLRVAGAFRDTYGIAADSDLHSLEAQMLQRISEGAKCLVISPILPSISLAEVKADAGSIKEKTGTEVLVLDQIPANDVLAQEFALDTIVRHFLGLAKSSGTLQTDKTERPSANIIGVTPSGFHNLGDMAEIARILKDLGVEVNVVLASDTPVEDIAKLPRAWFNIAPYREVGLKTTHLLATEHGMPYVDVTPMGVLEIRKFVLAIQDILVARGIEADFIEYINYMTIYGSEAAWFARSIDCQNLMTKKGVVFGDATHAAAMVKILHEEMGIRVPLAGTYCTWDAEWFREQVKGMCDDVLITDKIALVKARVDDILPDAVLGSQLERHMGKVQNLPTGVISAPVHLLNRRSCLRPMFGYEGTNVLGDLIYNSFTLGMEDHLLEMFGGHDTKEVITRETSEVGEMEWAKSGLDELKKIPGFVRGKVKRNTEKYARDQGITEITVEVLYKAKEAVSTR